MTNHEKSDIFSHFSSFGYLPHWAVLLMDAFLCTLAFLFAYAIGNHLFLFDTGSLQLELWQQTIIVLGVQLICFWIYHTYSGIIRYSTFQDVIKILLSLLTSSALLIVLNLIIRTHLDTYMFLTTVLFIYMLIAFLMLFCLRVGVKTLYEVLTQNVGNKRKVFIYGTKSAGLAIAKMLRSSGAESPYIPVGFIVDSRDSASYSLQGLRVYPINDRLFDTMKRKDVHDIIVSPTKMKQISPAKDLKVFLRHDINILTTPFFTEWDKDTNEPPKIGNIESIRMEDLLERPTIKIDTENVVAVLKDKVVMITGAAGSIGQEIVRQVLSFHPQAVILVEQAESPLHDLRMDLTEQYPDATIIPIIGDVRNHERMEHVFIDYRPDIVFHAAAYKHVPLMEEFPNEAVRANVLGTKNIADLSVKYDVQRFVMISTDKAVNPTNVMGASKRIAEIYVQSLYKKLSAVNPSCTRFITTRFGNVLGSNGSVIPYFKKQIAHGGPVTVTHPDIIRFFMTIPEACTLVVEAATLGNGGEIFIFDMGHQVKILDLAKNMIRLAGYRPDVDIPIVFTGLRPGEKLYEEVLNRKEITLPTENEKIKIARVREEDYDKVSPAIDLLIETARKESPMQTVALMKQIVPEYKPRNSIYEQLDR